MLKRWSTYFYVSLLCFILTFFNVKKVFSNFDSPSIQASGVEDLPLYKYLNEIKFVIEKQTDGEDDLSDHVLINDPVYTYISQEIDLIKKLTEHFKKKAITYNPRIEHNFFNICRYFGQFDGIYLRHLHQLRDMVLKFDEYLGSYLEKRKNLLPKNDLNLINDLQNFNSLLSEYLLDEGFVDATFLDKFIDFCVHRPIEFVTKNKKLACFGFVIGGTFIFYPYLKDMFSYVHKKYFNDESGDNESDRNSDEKITGNIIVLKVPKQKGLTCGKHAARNAIILVGSDTKGVAEEKFKKQGNQKEWFNGSHEVISEERKDKENSTYTDDLSGEEIEKILTNQVLTSAFMKQEFCGINPLAVLEKIVVIRDFERIEKGQGITEKLALLSELFKNGNCSPVCIIRPDTTSKNSSGHWFAIKIMKDPESEGGVRVWATDSLGDNPDYKAIARTVDLFTKNKIPSAAQIQVNSSVESCSNILSQLYDPGWQDKKYEYENIGKVISLMNKFDQAVDYSKKGRILDEKNRSILETIFNQIKERSKTILGDNSNVIDNVLEKEQGIQKWHVEKIFRAENFDAYLQTIDGEATKKTKESQNQEVVPHTNRIDSNSTQNKEDKNDK